MSNQRNINELEHILSTAPPDIASPKPTRLAEFLASRGCLVPSALTDDEVADLFDVPPGHAANRRSDLEKVAKGEK